MKRFIIAFLIIVPLGAAIGVAALRPDLVPKWGQGPGAHAHPDDGGLYCKEHGVPEKFCTICHPELTASLLWCNEHGVPEDICTLCHPDVKERYNVTTCEHNLPAEFCPRCGKGAAPNLVDDGWCAEHNEPEATCSQCEPGEESGTEHSHDEGDEHEHPAAKKVDVRPLSIVELRRPGLAEKIGLQTAPVAEERHAHRLSANAEVAYNASRYAKVRPRVSGFVHEIEADIGDEVQTGQVLAVIDSPEVGTAKTQYLAALPAVSLAEATLKRTTTLIQRDALPGKNQLEAEAGLNQATAELMNAEQRLRNLGFNDENLDLIRETRDSTSLLRVLAPIDGTIVARGAVAGEAVEPTTPLFDVADTSVMWAWIDLSERDSALVEKGQPVTFSIPGYDEGTRYPGRVTWIGTEVNPQTRTTRVRAELSNPDGRLRANQFGRAEIQVEDEHAALIVPKAAVQDFERARLVFIPQDDGSFRPQRVQTRLVGRPDVVEVTWGLRPGDHVVTVRSFLLKTELMRDALGAGCADDH